MQIHVTDTFEVPNDRNPRFLLDPRDKPLAAAWLPSEPADSLNDFRFTWPSTVGFPSLAPLGVHLPSRESIFGYPGGSVYATRCTSCCAVWHLRQFARSCGYVSSA